MRPGVGVPGGGYSYTPTKHCYAGCADSWLADKFCDQVRFAILNVKTGYSFHLFLQSCNKIECGFDVGDCGKNNYDQIYRIRFSMVNGTTYNIPKGIKNAYIDLTKVNIDS